MASKSLKELKELVQKELTGCRETYDNLKDSDNPQVVDMCNHTQGQIDALEAILAYATNGSKVLFSHR